MNINTTKRLNNGVEMPVLGLGVFRAEDGDETYNMVTWALEAGYRHIDTAAVYRNEKSVGDAIADSGIPRKDIFLTTKLWNEDMRQSRQEEGFRNSLELLRTDYVDLYLVHWPVPGFYVQSWKVLEKLYEQKHIRAIGVSNFKEHHLETLLEDSKITPAVNQVECHPLLNQEDLIRYCDNLDIAVTAWSPLGGGKTDLLKNPVLVKIGEKYGKNPAQIIIRWDLQRGIIVIPKSSKKERIIENMNVFDFELSPGDMSAINALNKNQRVGSDPDNFSF